MGRGRPKGKRVYPVTLALTEEQAEFLSRQPNASELVRQILDGLIAADKGLGDETGAIAIDRRIHHLYDEWNRLNGEMTEFIEHRSDCWIKGNSSEGGPHLRGSSLPTPKDTDKARDMFKIVKNYEELLKSAWEKIQEQEKKLRELP